MGEEIVNRIRHIGRMMKMCLIEAALAVLVGVAVGLVGTAFAAALSAVTSFRSGNPWVIFFLPLSGLVIAALYRLAHLRRDPGTSRVIASLNEGGRLPGVMAGLILISTLLTHLCGGSAGRGGAALQMGGSLGSSIARRLALDDPTTRVLIMCGMSAAFAAVYGTPMAAAVFSLEVANVGIMQYSGLLPCAVAAVIAAAIAGAFGIVPDSFPLSSVPDLTLTGVLGIAVLAVLCAGVSTLFLMILHGTDQIFDRLFTNAYVRILAGGCIIVVLTLVVGSQDYSGAGTGLIAEAVNGTAVAPWAFLLKMIFTAVTLEAGFKGGEIFPSFCIGATFGSLFGTLIGAALGLPAGFCAAIGMGAVFCGVTNCPITTLLFCFELLGFEGIPYFLIAIAVSYTLSGRRSLYSTQIFTQSKYTLCRMRRLVGDEEAEDEPDINEW